MKSIKRKLLTIGSIGAVVAPIVTIVSCSKEHKDVEESTIDQKIKAMNTYFAYLNNDKAEENTKMDADNYLELLLTDNQNGGPLKAEYALKVSNIQKILIENKATFKYEASNIENAFGAKGIRLSVEFVGKTKKTDGNTNKQSGGLGHANAIQKVLHDYEFRFFFVNNGLQQSSVFSGTDTHSFLAPVFTIDGKKRSMGANDFGFMSDNIYYANILLNIKDAPLATFTFVDGENAYSDKFMIKATPSDPNNPYVRSTTLPSAMDQSKMLDSFEAHNYNYKVIRDRFKFTPHDDKGEMEVKISDYTDKPITITLKNFKKA